MSIDEAIEHCLAKAKDKKTCEGCRNDHMQLARWLKELKKLREFKKHCELVHGTFFDELSKQGVIA